MGSVQKTPAGKYRAMWRDASGQQRNRTFTTKGAAKDYLTEVESSINRGTYVDPQAAKVKVGVLADRWLDSRNDEITTTARNVSIMRNHVVPRWGGTQLGKVVHLDVQRWVTELGKTLAPATVAECYRLLSAVMKAAVRERYIAANPCEGVRLPPKRKRAGDDQVITPAQLVDELLPVLPNRYKALVGLAGGAGLRWGECVGLRYDLLDLDAGLARVERTAVEVSGHVTAKQYPKSKAGHRTVPLAPFALDLLRKHQAAYEPGPAGEVFTNEVGGVLWRGHFRARVWRPALVRAGLLGRVDQLGEHKYRAVWTDAEGIEWTRELTTERAAVAVVTSKQAGGLTFHGLRHSYATWLVSQGVPINDVSGVLGHEQTSTTLNRYTHQSGERDGRVLGAFVAWLLPEPKEEGPE